MIGECAAFVSALAFMGAGLIATGGLWWGAQMQGLFCLVSDSEVKAAMGARELLLPLLLL
jgi:hypothetical protein